MISKIREHGDSKLGCAIWLILLLATTWVLWKAIPVKVNASELYDYMTDQAKYAGGLPAETLKKRILERADELGLPVEPKNLSVEKMSGRIRMSVDFTVPLNFSFYTYDWHFHHDLDEPVFII